MNKHLEAIVSFLDNNNWETEEDDFIGIQYDIVDNIEKDKIGFEIVKDVLELMEMYPLVEFGSPGPLTHVIESFYKENPDLYEIQIKQSVEECPTVHTVWLLNRLINGSQGEKAAELIGIMTSICKDDKIHKSIRIVAENFLKSHDD